MNSKREAKKILKAYGKAAYQERVKYVDSFSEEKAAFLRKRGFLLFFVFSKEMASF